MQQYWGIALLQNKWPSRSQDCVWYDGAALALAVAKRKPPNTDPQLGASIRGLLFRD